jgi:hypothetical protein
VYRYVNTWRVLGPIDEVAAVLATAESYPRWWPASTSPSSRSATKAGGERRRIRSQGFCRYAIEFVTRVVDEAAADRLSSRREARCGPRRLAARRPTAEWVDIVYRWQVTGQQDAVAATSWALRPLFEANHTWRCAAARSASSLELARRRADERRPSAGAVPPPPAPVRGASDVAAALVDVFHRRRAEPPASPVSP